MISPPEEILLRQLNARNMTQEPVASPTVAVQAIRKSSGNFATLAAIRRASFKQQRTTVMAYKPPLPYQIEVFISVIVIG